MSMEDESRNPRAESRDNRSGASASVGITRTVGPRPSALGPSTSYPIKQSEEHAVSRRQFAAFCGCAAVALAAGVPLKQKLLALPEAGDAIEVAGLEELPPGEALQFNYPTPGHPCLLIRLSETEFVAYNASCTHLMCPVHYDDASRQLVCPCHHGFFDATNGHVVAGPPRRPLPRYEVNVIDGRILVGPKLMEG